LASLYTTNCVESCAEETVPTNLAIDDRLIAEAQKLGHHRTKKETVNAALDEYVQRRKQQQILSLFGTIDYDGSYDYKRDRRKRA
jgi:Arc/MetJ family transcription regulator